jgi:hypothetical protein
MLEEVTCAPLNHCFLVNFEKKIKIFLIDLSKKN